MSPQHEMEAQSRAYRHIAHTGTNYTAQMSFEVTEFNEKAVERLFSTPHDDLPEKWAKALGIDLEDWQKSLYRNIMGSWQYTPRDELRNRLNARLKGWPPAPAVNTRFWRGL